MPESEVFPFIAVARIVKPQGRRGEVAAEILTDFPERFEKLHSAHLGEPGSEPRAVALESAWPHKGRVVLKFSGIDSIQSADSLRGLYVFVPREERVALPGGSYYLWELEGCRILSGPGGEEIGAVTSVDQPGGVPVLHIKRSNGRGAEILIPLAQEICTRIDTKAKTIWVEPPEDLLDLNE